MNDTRPRMQASDRRIQLLETALEIFARQGFEGTTTKEIATAAGITEAVIFRHFPNKQALYTAVLEEKHASSEFEAWKRETQDCMDRNDDAGLFRAIASKILRGYREDPRCQRVLLFAALEGHEQALAANRELSIPIIRSLQEYVVRRQKEGALRDYPAAGILAAVAGMAQHYAMMTQMFGFVCDVSDELILDTFTRIMMEGVQAPKSEKKGKQQK